MCSSDLSIRERRVDRRFPNGTGAAMDERGLPSPSSLLRRVSGHFFLKIAPSLVPMANPSAFCCRLRPARCLQRQMAGTASVFPCAPAAKDTPSISCNFRRLVPLQEPGALHPNKVISQVKCSLRYALSGKVEAIINNIYKINRRVHGLTENCTCISTLVGCTNKLEENKKPIVARNESSGTSSCITRCRQVRLKVHKNAIR